MSSPQISLLITAYREQLTIGNCIATLVHGFKGDFELILGCPDQETYQAAQAKVTELGIQDQFIYVKDPGQGKPTALNLMMNQARGAVWLFGDGDTYFGPQVIDLLLGHFQDATVMAVTGRPRSADPRTTMMGYLGHLLSDAAHHRRTVDLTPAPQGRSLALVKKQPFFPVSGYLFAMRASDIRLPEDCLVDDAYLSYQVFNQGGRIAYEPEAQVFVKYPTNLRDYFRQKKRSAGGYVQLWEYGIVRPATKTRSFWGEVRYFWYPLWYARSMRELIWSLLLYPLRLWLWIKIYWERKVQRKDFRKTWVRVESTK